MRTQPYRHREAVIRVRGGVDVETGICQAVRVQITRVAMVFDKNATGSPAMANLLCASAVVPRTRTAAMNWT
jgi:hypothetical protein